MKIGDFPIAMLTARKANPRAVHEDDKGRREGPGVLFSELRLTARESRNSIDLRRTILVRHSRPRSLISLR